MSEHKCKCRYIGCHINDCRRWCHFVNKEIPYEFCNEFCIAYDERPTQITWSDALQTDLKVSCIFIENMIKERIESLRNMIEKHKDAPKSSLNMLWNKKSTLEDLLSDLIKYRTGEIFKQKTKL